MKTCTACRRELQNEGPGVLWAASAGDAKMLALPGVSLGCQRAAKGIPREARGAEKMVGRW